MAPLIENPEALRGKVIEIETIGPRAFNALARANIGWREGQLTHLDAEALARAADTPEELSEKSGSRASGESGFYGVSQETAKKIVELLQELAAENLK